MASGTIDGKYYDNSPTPEEWSRVQGELADLQHRLQQAQEERDDLVAELQGIDQELDRAGWEGGSIQGVRWLKAERDAATMRAEAAESGQEEGDE